MALDILGLKARLDQAQAMVQTDLPMAMASITDVIEQTLNHVTSLEADVFNRITALESKTVTDVRGMLDGAQVDIGPLVIHLPKP